MARGRTMRAEVSRWFDGEMKPTIGFKDLRDGLMIECEISHPPSMQGRKVYVHLTERDRDELLLQLKYEAIRARRS